VAVDALAPPRPKKPGKNETERKKAAREQADRESLVREKARKRDELKKLLLGHPTTWMVEKLNAASWFSDANKLYNSGQGAFRDGQLSPWAMALACEGLSFLSGGASRRLGARSRALGAFPFITRPSGPEVSGEAGRNVGEIWAPLWNRPMTLVEVRALFARGRAEQHGRGAVTPAAFASAITSRGIDAGISEFRRFALGCTTSANTFEPRFEGAYVLQEDNTLANTSTATALQRVTAFIEQPRFPRDRKVGQRWRVAGVRGPIEAALLRVAAQPNDHEAAIAMLDAIVASLDRIDRNRSFRKEQLRWEPLPVEWVPSLFGAGPPGVEARLALSFVSGFPPELPFAVYRFGVEWRHGRFQHTERPPARWVWGPGELARVLSAVLARRILEEEAVLGRDEHESSGRAPLPATCSQVSHWLDGDVDEVLLGRWISRLALFDWRAVQGRVRDLAGRASLPLQVDGALSLFGLLHPLTDRRPVVMRGSTPPKDLFAPDTGARTSGMARSVVSLVRAGSLDAALGMAGSRYAMAGAFLARTDASWAIQSPERLAASFLFTITDRDRTALIERWLRPRRQQEGNETHG
jgi:CRISPR-associated protein Csx17